MSRGYLDRRVPLAFQTTTTSRLKRMALGIGVFFGYDHEDFDTPYMSQNPPNIGQLAHHLVKLVKDNLHTVGRFAQGVHRA